MKKKLFSLATFFVTNLVISQITLDHSFSSEDLQVYTNETETFYYTVGQSIGTIKIYSADYTLYKQFTPTSSVNISRYDNFILSKNIFDTDNLLEIVTLSGSYPNNSIVIYNENGTIVKDFVSGYHFDDEFDFHVYHDNTTNTNKLRLLKTSTNATEIYNLPSTSLANKEIQTKNKLSAFPIPTNRILNITNPENGYNKIEIYDTSGKLVMDKNFNNSDNQISINVEVLSKGVYTYKIGNLSSKFIKN